MLEVPEPIRTELENKGGIDALVALLPSENRMRRLEKVFLTVSDPLRLKVIRLLEMQPLCPCLLAQAVGVANSKLSYHLTMLQEVDLIDGEQRGRWIIYSLTSRGREILRIVDQLSDE